MRNSSLVSLFALVLTSATVAAAPIVGGHPAGRGDYPDVVAVLMSDGSLCSGTLLAADLVLTAGHCVASDPVEVVIGSVDLARPDGDRRAVKWSRAYPEWLDRYDVGVIMLEHPVAAKQRAIAQGCATRDRVLEGAPLEVVGFGLTTPAGEGDNTLLHAATLRIVDPTCAHDGTCNPAVAPHGEFTAGGDGADACFGDSGGPAYIATSHGAALFGVVSRGLATWGEPCGEGGVFVRADKVVRWIESVSGRKVGRIACDRPADDGGSEPTASGCHASGGVLNASLAIVYGALTVLTLRRARWRRRVKR